MDWQHYALTYGLYDEFVTTDCYDDLLVAFPKTLEAALETYGFDFQLNSECKNTALPHRLWPVEYQGEFCEAHKAEMDQLLNLFERFVCNWEPRN